MEPPRTIGSVSLWEKRGKINGETTPDPRLGFPEGKAGKTNRGHIPNHQPAFPAGKRAGNECGDPSRIPGSAPLWEKKGEFNRGGGKKLPQPPTPRAHPHPRAQTPTRGSQSPGGGGAEPGDGSEAGGAEQSPGRSGAEPGAAGAARAGPYLAHPCGCPFWSPRPSTPRAGRAAPGPRRRKGLWEL